MSEKTVWVLTETNIEGETNVVGVYNQSETAKNALKAECINQHRAETNKLQIFERIVM